MPYTKLAEFQSAPTNLRTAYEAKLPDFDRAEIFEDENGDAELRCYKGDKTANFRIEKDGAGGWLFFGGILMRRRQ